MYGHLRPAVLGRLWQRVHLITHTTVLRHYKGQPMLDGTHNWGPNRQPLMMATSELGL